MASAETVKQKIRSLTENANAAVKGSYATLSEAVADLIAGYGQGGGDTILDDLVDIHAWKKYKPVSIEQTEYSQVTISYKNPGGSEYKHLNWSTVKYADSIQIVGGAIYLVNPTSFTMTDTSDNDVVLGKYIQTSYNDSFYYIPEDTTIAHSKSVYGSGQYIKAYTAFALSVSPEAFLGYVVEDAETAYPESGEQDGYRYEYQGIVKTGEDVDTSDATATAEDLPEGVTAYAKGEKLVGTVTLWKSIKWDTPGVSFADGKLALKGNTNARRMLESGSGNVVMYCDGAKLGDAAASDVAKGKTFTSASGLKVEGTADISGNGIDTSDGTATAADIASGKTAYVNGTKVTGALFEVTEGSKVYANNSPTLSWRDDGNVETTGTYGTSGGGDGGIFRPGAMFAVRTPAEQYGDATAGDVAKGKTFTSAAGLLVVGTHECDTAAAEGNVHVWARTMALDIVLGTAESVNIAMWYNSNAEQTIQYADSVEIANGEVALVNPQSVALTPSQYNSDFGYLKGKYVTCATATVYIPSDGNITGSKTTTAPIVTTIKCTNAQKVTVTDAADTTANYVASTDRTAYPDAGTQDGYTYEYYGSL